MNRNDRDLDTFMAVAHAVAVEDAYRTPSTPESRERGRELAQFARDQVAAMRRAEHAKDPVRIVSGAIRPSILSMTKEAAIRRLDELFARHPTLQVAHREYAAMTEDDLRSALEDVESLVERAGE